MTTIESFWKQLKKDRTYRLTKSDVKPDYLIAETEQDVAAGKQYKIPVKKMRIEPNRTIHFSHYIVHTTGNVVGAGEEIPRPMDMERFIEYVIFLAHENGKVKKGDLLGYFMAVPLGSTE